MSDTISIKEECPSILDVLGFLKFPELKPISLNLTDTDKTSLLTPPSTPTQSEIAIQTESQNTSSEQQPTESLLTSSEQQPTESQLTSSTENTFQKGKGYKKSPSKNSRSKKSKSKKSRSKQKSKSKKSRSKQKSKSKKTRSKQKSKTKKTRSRRK